MEFKVSKEIFEEYDLNSEKSNIFKNPAHIVDFLRDTTRTSTVINVPISYASTVEPSYHPVHYLLSKVKGCNDLVAISVTELNSDSEIDTTQLNGYQKFDYPLTYDEVNDIIIYYTSSSFNHYFKNIFGNYEYNKDVKAYSSREIASEINRKYNEAINKLLNDNYEYYTENIPGYKEYYEERLNDIDTVEREYMSNPSVRYSNYKFTVPNVRFDEFTEELSYNLHKYLINPSVIDRYSIEYVYKVVADNFDNNPGTLKDHSRCCAYNKLLKSIKDNPSDNVKLVTTILDVTENVGKTLVITTKDGSTHKVINKLNNFKEFDSVKDNYYVDIKDISKITYGKKTLLVL